MARKPHLLHELLEEAQEPFRLKNYIADRRLQFKKPRPAPDSDKRRPDATSTVNRRAVVRKRGCFLPPQSSPDVGKSPLFDFASPAKSPRNGAVFLHVPSRTAALLAEAAMRIQNRKWAEGRPKTVGLGLLGSFLKRLKDRSRPKSRAIENGSKPLDFEDVWTDVETRFSTSPFRFNLLQSPVKSGRRSPELCSPAASPSRHITQENENYRPTNSDDVRSEADDDKEQCSPVSVLDTPFEDDDHVSVDSEDDHDDNLQSGYENLQRAKRQLLRRLRRFEALAELEPDRNLVEGTKESILTRVINRSRSVSTDMKKLVSDLIVEEKSEELDSCDNVVTSRICKRLDSWGEVEPNTIDMMIGFDLKGESDGWTRFSELAEDVPAEIEVAIYGLLVDEMSEELLYIGTRRQR